MSLWFVVPAHGRHALTRICLRQLRRTCDVLTDEGIEATAVVIACDENLDTARDLGFGTIERNNYFLSWKYNDGIQAALDPSVNPRPADYVVPCGSDDWVAPDIFFDLPPADTVLGFQRISFVREDGREMTTRFLNYSGGCGIRVYPRAVMAVRSFRPADEDRKRACDTSILVNLQRSARFKLAYRDIDPRFVVDWKSPSQQVTPYEAIARRHRGSRPVDPFEALAGIFPAEALAEMAAHYGRDRELIAV